MIELALLETGTPPGRPRRECRRHMVYLRYPERLPFFGGFVPLPVNGMCTIPWFVFFDLLPVEPSLSPFFLMPMGTQHPFLCKPYKKETPRRWDPGFMPATRRHVVVLPTKKGGGAAGSEGESGTGPREVHIPWERHKTKSKYPYGI